LFLAPPPFLPSSPPPSLECKSSLLFVQGALSSASGSASPPRPSPSTSARPHPRIFAAC
jgi:hypothetical protein